MFSMAGTAGGVVHLVHQGIMKITLFFCAGLFAESMGAHKISDLRGAGRRMPWTSAAFTVGAFGMIGLPPTAGFISKWQLGLGALDSPHPWVLVVLVVSSLLNAAYFLPVVYNLWFGEKNGEQENDDASAHQRAPEPWLLLVPALCTAAFALIVGLAASLPFSPLEISRFIADGVFS